MKILLDECVPFKLKAVLQGHHVYSVHMMGWSGIKNGDLIARADSQFDIFITIDKNLSYQQNLTRLRMAIILIAVGNNKVETVLVKSKELLEAIAVIQKSEFYTV